MLELQLWKMIHDPAFHYFWIQDKNPLGGTEKRRKIGAPNIGMHLLHTWLVKCLRDLSVDLGAATGSLPGCQPALNVKKHAGQRYFYLIDLSSAYDNVDGSKLGQILCQLEPSLDSEEVLIFLKRYCLTKAGGLIVGAPASPDLFNIYAAVLIDGLLRPLCEKYGLVYTRYLDDLTFSSQEVIGTRKRKAIRQIVIASGLPIQHRKCQVADLWQGPVFITGVGLDEDGRLFLPRHYLRKIRGMLHRAMYAGDVSRELVEGTMGAFKAVTKDRPLNCTEQRLVDLYKLYRRFIAVG
ncbi:MAG: reverse transcriptase domain-containing protein [bacterium]